MISKRQLVIGLLVVLLVFGVSCHKKQAAQKPTLPVPAEAPILAQTLPDEIPPQPLPQDPSETASAQEPPPTKARPHKSKKASATAQAKSGQPAGQAVGSQTASQNTTAEMHPPANPAIEVAIGPDVTSPEAARDRQSTTQSLDATEKDLKRVEGRSLNSDEQAMLAQIRAYIGQSRKAITDGDYERASNLAKKAQLLTDELLKK